MDTSRLSHSRALTPIRDPIHDYLDFTIFEREIIDSRYFQRLHFILQNSMTYVAYPANKNSRFAHSLGVSHIAGRIFSSALSNSAPKDLNDFLQEVVRFFKTSKTLSHRKSESLEKGWRKTIKGRSQFIHNPIFAYNADVVSNTHSVDGTFLAGFVIDTLWEAIRICGLVHDIGHLPMSHSFEHALDKIAYLFEYYNTNENAEIVLSSSQKFSEHMEHKKIFVGNSNADVNEKYYKWYGDLFQIQDIAHVKNSISSLPFHERRSLSIFFRISSINSFRLVGPLKEYRDFVWLLAAGLLFAQALDTTSDPIITGLNVDIDGNQPKFLSAIKKIIASELDADRMDYTVRDGHACGSLIGRFDLERIIKNAILVNQPPSQKDRTNEFHIAYYLRGVSGIEQFFSQRYDSYKYLINHRTSSRTEACLQELISRIFHIAYLYPKCFIASLLAEYGYISYDKNFDLPTIMHSHTDVEFSIKELLPVDDISLIRTDDASLRSLFFSLLNTVERSNNASSGFDIELPRHLLWPIECLVKIVLVRDFDHVYNPFKKISFRKMTQNSCGLTDSERDMKLFADFTRTMLTASMQRSVERELAERTADASNGRAISVFSIAKPKIFDFRRERDLPYTAIKVVNEREEVVNLSDTSEMLKQMYHRERQEAEVFVFFVGNGIKQETELMRKLYKVLASQIQIYFSNTLTKPRS